MHDVHCTVDAIAQTEKLPWCTVESMLPGNYQANPHTGEFIETKGGNHKGLKAWKVQYGAETVESWLN